MADTTVAGVDVTRLNEASAERIIQMRGPNAEKWRPFYCPVTDCDGKPHGEWTFPHARGDQHPPAGSWLAWAQVAGRGAGKTRSGTEWTHRLAKKMPGCRIALISPTAAEVRDTIIEGESGILEKAPPGFLPEYEPSKKKLTWPNGSTAYGYSGEEPNRLRGKQHHYGWLDEPAHMELIEDVWYNFLLGLRLGADPRCTLTTTPLPIKWLRNLLSEETTVVTRASTYDNLQNLPAAFKQSVLKRYEGTRIGRQEIQGELLGDVEGALWAWDMIQDYRIEKDAADLIDFTRVVVAIDPAGTATRKSDETGIVVVGEHEQEFYVLADYSGKYSPAGWADKALWAAKTWKADSVVVEITYGRDMVTSTINNALRSDDIAPRIVPVDSRRGKVLRADPVVTLYERGRVHHVGELSDLEDQQTTWIVGQSSPDRVDAVVHAITHLAKLSAPAEIGVPYQLMRNHRPNPYDLRSAV